MPKLAEHVKIGDHELLVDGEDFPWYITPDPVVTETGHPGAPYLVHLEIVPVDITDRERRAITCGPKRGQFLIGNSTFPWYFSDDGYQVLSSKITTLKLALLAKDVDDVRTPKVDE